MRESREPGRGPVVVGFVASSRSRPAQLAFGLLVIALGVLFTLDNLGVIAAGEILRWWPVVPLAFGLARLTGACCGRSLLVGLIFTLGGGLMLLHELGLVAIDPWDLWPVVLIAAGASMLGKSFGRRPDDPAAPAGPATGSGPTPHVPGARRAEDSTTFSVFAVLGHTHRAVAGEFRRGDAAAILGGHDLDLRGARIVGPSATLDVFSWWGSVTLVVPQNWRVAVEIVPVMGTVEDSSWAPAGEAAGTLIVRGAVVMSNLVIRN